MTPHRIDIVELVKQCQAALTGSAPTPIGYTDKVALEKNTLPPSLGASAINVYALWVRKLEAVPQAEVGAWKIMYIGQRSSKSGWPRVRQHLFSTPKGTQSKLGQVRAVIESGAELGVTAILVEPDSMRLAIEEELIRLNSRSVNDLPWNEKARSKARRKLLA